MELPLTEIGRLWKEQVWFWEENQVFGFEHVGFEMPIIYLGGDVK